MYELLEGFTDGFGSWKYLPYPGHLLQQDEMVIKDLLQWKYLEAIADKQKRKKEEQDASNTIGI